MQGSHDLQSLGLLGFEPAASTTPKSILTLGVFESIQTNGSIMRYFEVSIFADFILFKPILAHFCIFGALMAH